jgi:hypothetical protein
VPTDGRVLTLEPRFLAKDGRVLTQEPRFLATDARVLTREPHFLTKETHFLTKEAHFLTKNPRGLAADYRLPGETPSRLGLRSRFGASVPVLGGQAKHHYERGLQLLARRRDRRARELRFQLEETRAQLEVVLSLPLARGGRLPAGDHLAQLFEVARGEELRQLAGHRFGHRITRT